MSEHIVYIPDDMHDSDELFVGNIRKEKALIRCKDCVHKSEYGYCTFYINFHHLTEDMDYCSDAEGKEA